MVRSCVRWVGIVDCRARLDRVTASQAAGADLNDSEESSAGAGRRPRAGSRPGKSITRMVGGSAWRQVLRQCDAADYEHHGEGVEELEGFAEDDDGEE